MLSLQECLKYYKPKKKDEKMKEMETKKLFQLNPGDFFYIKGRP